MEELTLTDERVVRLGKFLWAPEQKYEEGICWFHAQKWDKKLVRFMTGKCVDLRSNKAGGSLDNDFYKDILLRRQQAFDKALAERTQELSDDEARAYEPAAEKRKGKVKAVHCNPARHKEYSPHHLAVKFQSLEVMGAEPEIKVLFEGLGKPRSGLSSPRMSSPTSGLASRRAHPKRGRPNRGDHDGATWPILPSSARQGNLLASRIVTFRHMFAQI